MIYSSRNWLDQDIASDKVVLTTNAEEKVRISFLMSPKPDPGISLAKEAILRKKDKGSIHLFPPKFSRSTCTITIYQICFHRL